MKSAVAFALFGAALSAPTPSTSKFCFIPDESLVPSAILTTLDSIADRFTCTISPTFQPITDIPDIILTSASSSKRTISFSKINYAESDQSPLAFSMGSFRAQEPLANNNLAILKDNLYVYLAMEASVLSHHGMMTSVVPRLFLEFQVARVSRAQGRGTTDAEVDAVLTRIVQEATEEGEYQALIDELRDMAIPNRVELRNIAGAEY